jgi:hypothetical protein
MAKIAGLMSRRFCSAAMRVAKWEVVDRKGEGFGIN